MTDATIPILNFQALVGRLDALVRKHEETQRTFRSGDLAVRAEAVLTHYQDLAVAHMAGVDAFRQDVLTYFRALVLLVESVANAFTHAEKAARLRGLVELLETAIDRVRKERLDFAFTRFGGPDLWRSDFPVREFVRRIRELEEKLAAAEGAKGPVDEQPF